MQRRMVYEYELSKRIGNVLNDGNQMRARNLEIKKLEIIILKKVVWHIKVV